MAYTFRRAARAIAMTSSTTCAAFLANTLSPLMPIKSFGVYAGLIVPINYILVISFFPAAIIILESHLKDCCTCCSKKDDNDDIEVIDGMPKEALEHQRSWNAKVEKFYETTFSDNVRQHSTPIFVVCGIWLVVAIWRTTQLKGLSKAE